MSASPAGTANPAGVDRSPALGGDDLVAIMAGTSWDGIWMPERHLAVHLAKRVPVLWVDPPISYLTPLRDRDALDSLRASRLREVAPNTLRLSPVTIPGVTRPLLRAIAARQARRAVRRAIDARGLSVRTTISAAASDMLDVLPTGQRVFYGTDDFTAGAGLTGADSRWLERKTLRQLEIADLVIATSPALKEKWSAHRPDIHVVPNGCDAEHFADVDRAPLPSDVSLPGPIAGFVGHMSERIDVGLLEAVAKLGVSLLLVGPRQPAFAIGKLDTLLGMPNVQWVGPKGFDELPSYLRVIDLGLTPYTQSVFNHASFPLKTLEYLAAGRPVVATDLPAHRWLDTPHVRIVDTAAEFAGQVGELLHRPRRDAEVRARQAFAARHSWAGRAAAVSDLLDLADAPSAQPSRER